MADRYRTILAQVEATLDAEDTDPLGYGRHATGDERDPELIPLRGHLSGLLPGGVIA